METCALLVDFIIIIIIIIIIIYGVIYLKDIRINDGIELNQIDL
jgi:hypothetical protein